MEQDKKYQQARRRVKELKGFYIHALNYLLVNALLVAIYFLTTRGDVAHNYWFKWPLMGWGVGLAFHGLAVFGFRGFLGEEWEEKKIREIMDKDKK